VALGGRIRARSADGERAIDAGEFFLGPFTTSLRDGELVTEVVIPVPEPGSGSAYRSVEHPASGFALAGAAALVHPDGNHTVAVTGIGSTPFALGDDGLARAEVFDERHAPAEYRRHVAEVVVRRAVEAAHTRAEEDRSWRT
jgi:aerobic carbon-monoxide dehydrogenase medium subunit